jgi:hypothetical protein
LPVRNTFRQMAVGSSCRPSFAMKFGSLGGRLQFAGDAMINRIISELSDKSYETVLAICGACGLVSLFLAATV